MVITIVRGTYKPPSTGDDVRVSCEFVGSDTTPQPYWTKPDGYQIEFIIPGKSTAQFLIYHYIKNAKLKETDQN